MGRLFFSRREREGERPLSVHEDAVPRSLLLGSVWCGEGRTLTLRALLEGEGQCQTGPVGPVGKIREQTGVSTHCPSTGPLMERVQEVLRREAGGSSSLEVRGQLSRLGCLPPGQLGLFSGGPSGFEERVLRC